jgi:hypothetical protein
VCLIYKIIAFKVKERKRIRVTKAIIKIIVVCGRCNKFKKGPIIVKTSPIIEDIKNLGNLKVFSQKSGIVNIPIIPSI